MRPLNSSELLNVWERSSNRPLFEKALILLNMACSDGEPEDPALLSIGNRDALLLQLREWMFGPRFLNVTRCPACSELIEWVTDISDLRFPAGGKTLTASYSLQVDTFNIQFRLPNSYDLFRVYSDSGYQSNPKKLLTDCIIEVLQEKDNYNTLDLPADVLDVLDQRMSIEDAQAEINMALTCPGCSHKWESKFDIVNYLWMEIDSWARNILKDVAMLAAAFSWSETQILSMSPQRRQLYLDIIRK
jgi:hypothetical protein